jgi:hypothetical protein
VNTLGQHLSEILDSILRPLRDGLEVLTSGLRALYRLLQEAIAGLVEMGRGVLDALSTLLRSMVEQLQEFIRSAMSTVGSRLAEMLLDVLGERA